MIISASMVMNKITGIYWNSLVQLETKKSKFLENFSIFIFQFLNRFPTFTRNKLKIESFEVNYWKLKNETNNFHLLIGISFKTMIENSLKFSKISITKTAKFSHMIFDHYFLLRTIFENHFMEIRISIKPTEIPW